MDTVSVDVIFIDWYKRLIKYRCSRDYVGRFNGIVEKGIYKGETILTPRLRKEIEKEFPNSKNHYILACERYVEYKCNTR